MGYSAIASTIKDKAKSVNTAKNKIKTSSFDSIWKGSAHDTLITDLKDTITKIGNQKASADKFAEALVKIDKYKKNKEYIEFYRDKINNLVDTDKTKYSNAIKRNRYNNKIENYNYFNSNLKREISSILNSIASVSSELDVVSYDSSLDDSNEYVVNVQDFLAMFNNQNLRTLGANNSRDFFDYYTQENFESRMNEIKSQYSGRDAAVNCALGAMEMAAKVGGKLNLGWGPDFNETQDVVIGAKYNSFASWAVNQGSEIDMTATGIINAGNNTKYEDAQKGDILVSSSGQIVMIVDNDAEEQQFVLAEVSNPEDGVVVQAKSYASLTGTYRAMDLSSIYND